MPIWLLHSFKETLHHHLVFPPNFKQLTVGLSVYYQCICCAICFRCGKSSPTSTLVFLQVVKHPQECREITEFYADVTLHVIIHLQIPTHTWLADLYILLLTAQRIWYHILIPWKYRSILCKTPSNTSGPSLRLRQIYTNGTQIRRQITYHTVYEQPAKLAVNSFSLRKAKN